MGASAIIGGIGSALSAAQGIGSGIKGKQGQSRLNARQKEADAMFDRMANQGMDAMGRLNNNMDRFQNTGLQNQVLGMAQGAIPGIQDNWSSAADAMGRFTSGNFGNSAGSYQNNVNIPDAIADREYSSPELRAAYDFSETESLREQSTQNALDAGARARTSAIEQMASQNQGFNNSLDAALASRGISRGSGAAGAALADQARGNAQSMGQLERDLANQAQAASLQGAQMDNQNLLATDQMASQYGLNRNQLEQGTALNQFQANLGADQAVFQSGLQGQQLQAGVDAQRSQHALEAGRQGLMGSEMQMQALMQQANMRNQGLTQPIDMMQGIYQQNYLQPEMQTQGQLASLGGTMAGIGGQGIQGGLENRARGVQSAGAGMGAAMGNSVGFLEQMLGGLTGKETPNVGMNPAQSGDWMDALLGGSSNASGYGSYGSYGRS